MRPAFSHIRAAAFYFEHQLLRAPCSGVKCMSSKALTRRTEHNPIRNIEPIIQDWHIPNGM